MTTEIKVPQMGESISEAVVGTILKPTGSKVLMDDEILELETDKVNQVLYAQQEGIVTITVKTGEVVSIGQVIGTIDLKGIEDKSLKKESEKKTPENKDPSLEVKATEDKTKEEPSKVSIEPSEGARILKENFIAELVDGKKEPMKSPPVKSSPVEKLEKRDVSEQKETRRKMSKIRQVIAKRLVEAQHNTAMLTTFNEVDMSLIMQLRANYKDSFIKEHGVKLGFMSFFIKASVVALQEYPDINSYIEGDEIVHRNYYDIGVAVGTEKGLFVPVIRDCDRLSFAEIEKSIEEFAKKAKSGKLVPQDLQGGGFTITNGGVYGSLLSTPILNPPQSGILGMHKIEKRPVVINDEIVIRPMMYLALSYDHRIVDGKEAVSFLVSIKNCLEDPSHLLLNM